MNGLQRQILLLREDFLLIHSTTEAEIDRRITSLLARHDSDITTVRDLLAAQAEAIREQNTGQEERLRALESRTADLITADQLQAQQRDSTRGNITVVISVISVMLVMLSVATSLIIATRGH